MNSFLRNTAESILNKIAWKDLNYTTLVLPSHRAGLVLKNELLSLQKERQAQAIWAPSVKTLQQLQNELSPLYEEDELLTIVRLYRHYRELMSERVNELASEDIMSPDMFLNYGRQMLADFTNVDASMTAEQVPNFFDNTIAAHELGKLDLEDGIAERLRVLIKGEGLEVSDEGDSLRKQYEQIWKNLYRLYEALHAEMLAAHKGYSGMRQRAVIEHWDDESVQEQIRGRMFIFVGFNYLLPVERQLMERLKDAGQAMFYWDFVPNFQTNEKAFEFTLLNSGRLGSERMNELTSEGVKAPREVTVMACASREAQAQYVHKWLQQNYTARGQKVGVVISDETLLESVIYTLPAITLPGEETPAPINITKGFPLRNTHVFTRVLAWLYDKQRGDVNQVVTPQIIDQLLAALIPDQEESEGASEHSDTSDEGMNWKELLIMESEYQVRKVANQMRKLICDGLGDIPFTLKLLRLLMRRTMENVTMPFHGEPVTDIQVMGVLETRLLDFDKLLILNVEEGVLPQKQADSSFIPYYLRKAYSMQTSDERATVYAYNFFRLLSRAGHSTLLFTTTDGAENSKGMSRFLMQIMVNPTEFKVVKQQLDEPSVLTEIDDARLQTEGVSLLSMLHADENGVLRREDGSRFSLSPSALNTYISCPRWFCLQYIKHWSETEKEEKQFSPATLGSFVHNAMYYLYHDYMAEVQPDNKVLSPDFIDRIVGDEALLQQALEKAYEMMNAEWSEKHEGETNHYILSQHTAENPVILQYMRNVLQHDKIDAEKGLEIYLLEEDRRCEIKIDEIGKLRTGGRIDRMDIIGKGDDRMMRIVDYKSGSYDEEDMSTTMDDLMQTKDAKYIRQTLMYSHAVVENEPSQLPIEPNLFFCSRDMNNILTTLTIDGQPISDFRTIQESFIDALKTKIKEVLTTTSFPPCEKNDCASYCPFLEICRRKVYKIE